MKNYQQGFVIPLIIGLVAILAIGGGVYVYIQNKSTAPSSEVSGDDNIQQVSVIDLKDVKDFDTCMSYAKNTQISFDVVFSHGSDFEQVKKFADDFKNKYPRATLEKVSSETDFINYNLEINKGSLYTENQRTDYKKMLAGQAYSAISIRVPIIDLGTKESFNGFISATLKNYPLIKFQQYSGSTPDISLDQNVIKMSQQSAEKQCNYKYKQLNESDRSALQIKNDDSLIQTLISSTRVGATFYHDANKSYANGSLSLNNGLCSDAGENGIKKMLDSIKEKAGAVYCYASSNVYAVSAPLKSNPATGYCSDSTGFYGAVSSPTAASKGYCNLPPPEKKIDISSCQNGNTARERWICVGNIVDPQYHISDLVSPYAKPNADKINSCKTLSGIEADYCFASIVKSGTAPGFTQEGASICSMVSNKNPWFKNDCTTD